MLEDKDIEKLVSVLATKQDVNKARQDINDLRELVQGLIVATDKMATSMSTMTAEYSAISVQLTRHEKWIKQLSEKLGIELSFK
jgi:hypothetical protein